ncbi:hypothetical protein QT972_16855, partial [Microcoleus sp. herbarium7]|uniref:hypothetical protein n=1 Tax=Microcoleus sp. herbarium7 TaxID=3055435 RepID=UPI002FD0805A
SRVMVRPYRDQLIVGTRHCRLLACHSGAAGIGINTKETGFFTIKSVDAVCLQKNPVSDCSC